MKAAPKAVRGRTRAIRRFLLDHADNPEVVSLAVTSFDISRQAVHRHLKALIEEGLVDASGSTRNRKYNLRLINQTSRKFSLKELEEDVVWREVVKPTFPNLPGKAEWIAHYAFTEMLNNAIDHSDGTHAVVTIKYSPAKLRISISDNGIGIFSKIKDALALDDERHSMLELTKGKFTTDPSRHSGLGIYFTSRACDYFTILSGRFSFMHLRDGDDWLLDDGAEIEGTRVILEIDPETDRLLNSVFEAASTPDNPGFSRTHIPVAVAQYGEDNLVSRSQAKRLLARVNRFKEVILDFKGVDSIGQGFADEIFRVYQRANPDVHIVAINPAGPVRQMIDLAKSSA